MGDIVNLNHFRKKQDRKKAGEKARNNRVRHGRSGLQKKQDRNESKRNNTELEHKKLIREDEDDKNSSPES